MNKTVFIPSIKFGGGAFLADKVFSDLEQSTLKNPLPGTVVWDNIYRGKLTRMYRLALKSIVVIPIIHPRTIAYHWLQSKQEMDPDFYRMWGDIWSFEEEGIEPFFFVLDDEDTRDDRLAELSELVKMPLIVDWAELDLLSHDMVSDMHLLEEADRVRETEKLWAGKLDRFYGDNVVDGGDADDNGGTDDSAEANDNQENDSPPPKKKAAARKPAARKQS